MAVIRNSANSGSNDRFGFNGQYKDSQAGVTEKVILEIKGIPPGINSFSIVSQSFVAYTIGVTNSRNSTELTFRNVPIAWE